MREKRCAKCKKLFFCNEANARCKLLPLLSECLCSECVEKANGEPMFFACFRGCPKYKFSFIFR